MTPGAEPPPALSFSGARSSRLPAHYGRVGHPRSRSPITSSMSTLLLKNGRVIDPSRNYDSVADLWLADGTILGTGAQNRSADRTLDCTGLIISPGLID